MKIIFAMHGKPKDKRIWEIIEEYKIKIGRYQKIELEFLSTPLARQGGGQEVENILERYLGKKIYLLDEDGKQFTSQKFAEVYEKELNSGVKEVVFVIGPAEGFAWQDITLAESAGQVKTISLSSLAMQHDIAALVLIEQIYRAISIKNNLPYHKI
jgi:23S rRNA (pseudouridine1915-N3)-methyltransferase